MRTPRLFSIALVAAALLRAQDLAPLRLEISGLAGSSGDDQSSYIGDLCDSAIRAKLLNSKAMPDLSGTRADGERSFQEILAFRRADVQNGSSGGASGSTSAVLSPLLPAIFGVGFETGSMTRTVSGTTVSIKANPAGLFCVSGNQAAGVALRDDAACSTFWNRIGVTASFDTSRGEKKTELADLQTLDNQLAEFTVRAELLNHRKASGPRFHKVFDLPFKEWQDTAQRFADLSAEAAAGALETQLRDDLRARLKMLVQNDGYRSATEAERVRQIEDAVKAALGKIQGEVSNLASRRRLWLDSLRANAKLRQDVDNASVLTAEYSLERPNMAKGVRAPSLQSLRLIFAKGWGDRKLDLTANAAASFFSETRPGMSGAFRDFRAGAEAKWKLREVNNYGAPTLSFAALYVFLNQEPLGLGLVAFNQAQIRNRGNIGLFQTKLEFPAAKNGIRIPLSFTYSNRTELIQESDVRAQVGISFNLDTLFVPSK
jgi:hypothetical protein